MIAARVEVTAMQLLKEDSRDKRRTRRWPRHRLYFWSRPSVASAFLTSDSAHSVQLAGCQGPCDSLVGRLLGLCLCIRSKLLFQWLH